MVEAGHQASAQRKDTRVSQYCHRIHQNHPSTVATSSGQCPHNSLDLEVVKILHCHYMCNTILKWCTWKGIEWQRGKGVRSGERGDGRRLARRLSIGVSGGEFPCVPSRYRLERWWFEWSAIKCSRNKVSACSDAIKLHSQFPTSKLLDQHFITRKAYHYPQVLPLIIVYVMH